MQHFSISSCESASKWQFANTTRNETRYCFVFLLLDNIPLLYYAKFTSFQVFEFARERARPLSPDRTARPFGNADARDFIVIGVSWLLRLVHIVTKLTDRCLEIRAPFWLRQFYDAPNSLSRRVIRRRFVVILSPPTPRARRRSTFSILSIFHANIPLIPSPTEFSQNARKFESHDTSMKTSSTRNQQKIVLVCPFDTCQNNSSFELTNIWQLIRILTFIWHFNVFDR